MNYYLLHRDAGFELPTIPYNCLDTWDGNTELARDAMAMNARNALAKYNGKTIGYVDITVPKRVEYVDGFHNQQLEVIAYLSITGANNIQIPAVDCDGNVYDYDGNKSVFALVADKDTPGYVEFIISQVTDHPDYYFRFERAFECSIYQNDLAHYLLKDVYNNNVDKAREVMEKLNRKASQIKRNFIDVAKLVLNEVEEVLDKVEEAVKVK